MVLSARTESGLRLYAERLKAHIEKADVPLASLAYTLQRGRDSFRHRLAILAGDLDELSRRLDAFLENRIEEAVRTGDARQFKTLNEFLSRKEIEERAARALAERDLEALARLWLNGCDDISWENLYDPPAVRVSLPTYPFETRSLWYEAVADGPKGHARPGKGSGRGEFLEGGEKDAPARATAAPDGSTGFDVEESGGTLGQAPPALRARTTSCPCHPSDGPTNAPTVPTDVSIDAVTSARADVPTHSPADAWANAFSDGSVDVREEGWLQRDRSMEKDPAAGIEAGPRNRAVVSPEEEGASAGGGTLEGEERQDGLPLLEEIQAGLVVLVKDVLLLRAEDELDAEAVFLDLGVDSVNSVRLVHKLSRALGLPLRETLLFEYPTIGGLAEYIRRQAPRGFREGSALAASPEEMKLPFRTRLGTLLKEYEEIVPLQIEGDGPLLFCIHPMSGDAGLYGSLADAARERFRVLGIRARGFLTGKDPLTTIEEMGEYYAGIMTAVDPKGPWHVLGSSMGGTVAFECFRRLLCNDRCGGGTLFLLEAPVVEKEADAALWDSDEIQNLVMNANFLMITMLHMDPEFRRRKDAGEVRWPDLEIRCDEVAGVPAGQLEERLSGLIQGRGVKQAPSVLVGRLESMARIHLANLRALRRYRPGPLPAGGKLDAFLVRTRSADATSADVYNPDYLIAVQKAKGGMEPFFDGWKRVLPEFETRITGGENHFDLLGGRAGVGELADFLAGVLCGEGVPASRSVSLPAGSPQRRCDFPFDKRIAVVGMSGQFPGGKTLDDFWRLLSEGRSAFTPFPDDRGWDLGGLFSGGTGHGANYVRRGGFLEGISGFDPLFFQIPPREAELMDPAERFFLQESWRAIEDAGIDPAGLSGKRWGVFCGGGGDYTLRLKELSGVSPHVTASGIPGRVAYCLNLTGPSVSVDAGCASSGLAIVQACDSLVLGKCEAAIAGGALIYSTPNLIAASYRSRLLSTGGHARALDERADGMMPSETVGVLVLKLLSRALEDGDRIHGVIEGWGNNHSGRTNGMAAPGLAAREALFEEIYGRFGIRPETIGLVEANANGNPLGDVMEVRALTEVFRKHTDKRRTCALGSVENNIGHSFQSSAMNHVMKVLLALRHGEIPPTVGVETPNPSLGLEESSFFINTQSLPWKSGNGDGIRRAAVNSFGATGANVHLVIAEAGPSSGPKARRLPEPERPALIVLSARTKESLEERCRDLAEFLERGKSGAEPGLARLSANLLLRRAHFRERCALVVADREELWTRLIEIASGVESGDGYESAGPVREMTGPSGATAGTSADSTKGGAIDAERENLLVLAGRYVRGEAFDVSARFSEMDKIPISLPGYPFEKRRCWIDSPGDSTAIPGGAAAVPAPDAALDAPPPVLAVVRDVVVDITGYRVDELDAEVPLNRFGLDSLMSMRLLAILNERFSLDLQLADLLEHDSISGLASLVERKAREERKAAREDARQPFPAAASEQPSMPGRDDPIHGTMLDGEESSRQLPASRRDAPNQERAPYPEDLSMRTDRLSDRLAPLPAGLHDCCVELKGLAPRSISPEVSFEACRRALSGLAREGVAVFREETCLRFLAHRSIDIRAMLDSFPSAEIEDLCAHLPPWVLAVPVSREQERNLYHSEVLKQPAWNIRHVYESTLDSVDISLLNRAMASIVGRHDLLRTTFLLLEGSWAQIVWPDGDVEFKVVKVPSLQDFQEFIAARQMELLDVEKLPLLHAWTARIEGKDYFGFVTHHGVADAFTTTMLFSELMHCCSALAKGGKPRLKAVGEQYWQYSLGQWDASVRRSGETRRYWQEELSGGPFAMRLPFAKDPGAVGKELLNASESGMISLPASLCMEIKRFNLEFGISLSQLFTAAVGILLVHGMGNSRAVIHLVNNQRDRASLLNTPGEFTNILFLPFGVESDARVLHVLDEVKKKILGGLRHAKVDFRSLLTLAGLDGYAGYYGQLGDVMVDVADIDAGAPDASEVHGRSLFVGMPERRDGPPAEGRALATLFYQVLKVNRRIHLIASCRKHLFDGPEMEELSALVCRLVEEMVREPERRVGEVLAGLDGSFERLRERSRRFRISDSLRAARSEARDEAVSSRKNPPFFLECQRVNRVREGRPVFWVHGAFGDASVYVPLAEAVRRPFYGIQARGLFDDKEPLSGVEAIASFYRDMICSIQPDGPYDLGGYSVGGTLVYEVARRLQEAGRTVRSLTLADPLYPPYHRRLGGSLYDGFYFLSLGLVYMTHRNDLQRAMEIVGGLEKPPVHEDRDVLAESFTQFCLKAGVGKPAKWIGNYIRKTIAVQAGYKVEEYAPRPLLRPIPHVRYFKNRDGLFFGRHAVHMNPSGKDPLDGVDYWSEWKELLPNIEYREISIEGHLMLFESDAALRAIRDYCSRIYHEETAPATVLLPGEAQAATEAAAPEEAAAGSTVERIDIGKIVAEILGGLLDMDPEELDFRKSLKSYGMDSILATQLLQRLQMALEVGLDIGTIIRLDTAQEIVQCVRDLREAEAEPAPEWEHPAGAPAFPSVRTFQRFPELIRLNRISRGRPVFWFHGGMGGVEAYQVIAEKCRRPFFGIEARGWMTDRAPLDGVQAMAAYYSRIIEAVQPEGPYDLGGYSLGGTIAYETTRQLQEMGERVSTIVMLDAYDPSVFGKSGTSRKKLYLAVVNIALQTTIMQNPELLRKTLIHRDEVDPRLDDDAFLDQLVALARMRGLTKADVQLQGMIQRMAKVPRAFENDDYSVLPLSDPQAVECYYFRNVSGSFLGELEPYYTLEDGQVSFSGHMTYWNVWERQLPNLHIMDVDSSNHMMLLSEPKAFERIRKFCEILYSERGLSPDFLESFKTNRGTATAI